MLMQEVTGMYMLCFKTRVTEVFEQKTQAAPGWQGAEESNVAN